MLFVLFVIMMFVYPPIALFILVLGIGSKVLRKS